MKIYAMSKGDRVFDRTMSLSFCHILKLRQIVACLNSFSFIRISFIRILKLKLATKRTFHHTKVVQNFLPFLNFRLKSHTL